MAKEKADKKPEGPVNAPPTPEPSVGGYETFDGEEAQKYNRNGGHLVSVTPRYPSAAPHIPSFRPGKRYKFLEPKAQLDQFVAQAGEG